MKKIILILSIASGLTQITKAQTAFNCDQTGIIVNVGSQQDMVTLYHGGPVYTMPFETNMVIWEITDTQGNLITKDTIVDDPHYACYHNIPTTDTINVSAYFTNDSAIDINGNSINCLIEDQLYWEITELMAPSALFPLGIYSERWAFIHENLGVDQNSITAINESQIDESKLKIYPSPTFNYLNLEGPKEDYSLQILNIQGQLYHEMKNINGNKKIDVSFLPSGLYFVNLNYNKGNQTIRFIKQ